MDCKVESEAKGKTLRHSISTNDWKFGVPDSNSSNNGTSIDVKIVTGAYGDTCGDTPPKEDEVVDYKTKFWIGDDVVENNKQLLKITIHNVGERDSIDPLKIKYFCPENSTLVEGSQRPSKGMFTSDTWILRELKKGTNEFIMWNCLIDSDSAGEMFEYRMKDSDFVFPGKDSNPEDNLDWNRRRIHRHCNYDYNSDGKFSAIDLVHIRKIILGTTQKIPGKSYNVERTNKPDGPRFAPISSRHLVKFQRYILGQSSWEDVFGSLRDCVDITPKKP